MPRITPTLELIEHAGQQYPDLSAAQKDAMPTFAGALSGTLQRLLASGILVKSNGRIIPNPERTEKK